MSSQDIVVSRPKHILIKTSAPGKVILHGEHSVVYGKMAVAASLGLRTHVELLTLDPIMDVERVDVILHDVSYDGSFELGHIKDLLESPTPTLSSCELSLSNPECLDHDALVQRVKQFLVEASASAGNVKFAELAEQQQTALLVMFYLFKAILSASRVQIELQQMLVRVKSELHLGCGIGSSAAYAVALAAALVRFVAVDDGHRHAPFVNESELANISKWAFQAERIMHGTPSGIDNTICTLGYWVEFVKDAGMEPLKLSNTKFRVILINTLTPRNTKALVKKVGVLRQKHPRIIDGVLDLMDVISQEAVQNLKNINGGSGDVLTFYENLQDLSELNHKMLRTLDVSHPKIEAALEILASNGLKGKLTGAGGGGCVICMVPPYIDQECVESSLKLLHAQNYSAELTDLAGEGVRLDD